MKEIALRALEIALRKGANEARITCERNIQLSLSSHNKELERIQKSSSSFMTIQIYVDGRYGSFGTNRMEQSEIEKFIGDAVLSTKLLSVDLCRRLPDKDLYYKGGKDDLRQYDKSYDKIDIQQKKELLASLTDDIDINQEEIISISGEYEDAASTIYIVDSNGFEGHSSQTIFNVMSECTIKDKNDSRPQNWWYDSSINFEELPSGCGKKALERAKAMRNPKKVNTGKYSVIVDYFCASQLISPIISALFGSSIQQKNSFLNDSLGKQLFPEILTFSDSPHLQGEVGARYFDSDGVATYPHNVIDRGVIQTYYLNTYIANKLGCKATVDSPSILTLLNYGEKNIPNMINSIGKGLLITGFNGGNCNEATGDFSYGIEGFIFENGLIKAPFRELNMTGNILSLWNNILFIGDDARKCSRWKVPSLSFKEVDISGL